MRPFQRHIFPLAERQVVAGQRPPADRPNNLHLCLFRHFKCVIYLDAEVPDCTFKFRMPE
jgi:hypothetical protein